MNLRWLTNNRMLRKFSRQDRQVVVVSLLIVLGLFGVFLLPLLFIPPRRVGDGSEYYALYCAWKYTLRPWMTPESFSRYVDLFNSGTIRSLLSPDVLMNSFPALQLSGSFDFNHFWFYSLLAALVGWIASIFNIFPAPQTSFILLHWLLLCLPAVLAYKYFGWRGLAAVLLLTFVSPMLWYIDKVHTEFFTFCLSLTAFIFVLKHRYIFAAVAFAMVSTQNPSFAVIGLLLLGIRIVVDAGIPYDFCEVLGGCVAILLMVIHPAYYLFRFGVITPQLLNGGADWGENLSFFYVWLLDPDLGLLPNWPLGGLTLLAGSLLWRKRNSIAINPENKSVWWLFVGIYLIICLYAQSSTSNLNSGATPGLARYALWYIPLFFPLLMVIFAWLSEKPKRYWLGSGMVLVLAVTSFSVNNPVLGESFYKPSWFSYLLQKNVSWLYNPPPEVFAERYSGREEATRRLFAVIGPDCRKVLLLPGDNRNVVSSPGKCHYDSNALTRVFSSQQHDLSSARFIQLSDDQINHLGLVPSTFAYYFLGSGGHTMGVLLNGWSIPEAWGVWSNSSIAFITLPCPSVPISQQYLNVEMIIKGFASTNRMGTEITIRSSRNILWTGMVEELPMKIILRIETGLCSSNRIQLEFDIPNPQSPAQLGISDDDRMLGIGLIKVGILP
jgi:hypothetical protein